MAHSVRHLTCLMIVVLILSASISALLGDYLDAAAIAVIVVFNAALGFVQEYRAEHAIQSLRNIAVPTARLRRDGRVIHSVGFETQESALTGESRPVVKLVASRG